MDIFTRDNITLALSIFGSVGTLISWLYLLVRQMKNIDIRVIEHNFTEQSILVYLLFENKSRLPIAITDIVLVQDSKTIHCEPIPTLAFQATKRVNNEIVEQIRDYTLGLPIQLETLGAKSGYVYFEVPPTGQQISSKSLTVQICTNRGKPIQKILQLSDYKR